MVSPRDKKSVLVPIIFFSWFKFPLTLKELRRYIWRNELTETEILATVAALPEVHWNGELVWWGEWTPERELKDKLARDLWRQVGRWRWLFAQIPFLRQVYVTNTLAYDNANPNSDIDLLLVGQPGRLWLMRAILLTILSWLNLRVRSMNRFNKFSLEFFVSERVMNVKRVALTKDYYLTYWLADLVPIWPDGEHRQFRQANQWWREELPLAWRSPKIKQYRYLSPSWLRQGLEKILSGRWGDGLEDWAYTKQRRIIELNLRRLGVRPEVIVNRDIIKLHFNDRRALVRDAIEQTLHEIVGKNK